MRKSSRRDRIDLSFRMWSDHISLRQPLEDAGFDIKILHAAGFPIALEGRPVTRIASRHYASTSQEDVHDNAQVASWCRRLIDRIENHIELDRFLRSGHIEGLIWMALLGAKQMRLPHVPDDVIAACQARDIGVLVEDYTAAGGDRPVKHWIVPAP